MTKAQARKLIDMLAEWAEEANADAFKEHMANNERDSRFLHGRAAGINMAIGAIQQTIGENVRIAR